MQASEYMTMRLRPLRLAWYMARSAWCSSSLMSVVCSDTLATPRLIVTVSSLP